MENKLYKAHISREHGTFRIVEVLMPIQSIPNWYHCREQGTSKLMNVNRDMLEEIKNETTQEGHADLFQVVAKNGK